MTQYIDGDHDWMDADGGKQAVEKLRQAGNGQGRMYIVNQAGHHGTVSIIVVYFLAYLGYSIS